MMVKGGMFMPRTYRKLDVSDYIITKDSSANVVRFKDGSETVKENVFVIGGESAAIKLPEASA